MTIKRILLVIIIFIAIILRFYHLAENPPGMYSDEVSIGYNAHTILTHGVDEYGTKFPLAFKSYGDYKMPSYIYFTAISEFFFGENEFAVRFPSALAGVFTVIVLYFLLQALLQKTSENLFKGHLKKYLPLLSTFLLAISPWHIQFSRGGFEVTVATFFYLTALYFVVLYINKRSIFLLLASSLFFALTLYTYYMFRIRTPLVLLLLIIALEKSKKANWQSISLFTGAFLLFCIPTILFSFSIQGLSRFSQVSVFNNYKTNSLIEGISLYPLVIFKNYLSFFSLPFLFVTGDGIGRHQMPWFGLLPKWQLLFLLSGIYFFIKSKKNTLFYGILGMLLIAPFAASLAVPSPHSLRSLSMVIPLCVLISIGIIGLISSRKKFIRWLAVGLISLGVLEFIFYLHFYYALYPKINQYDWGAGYKQLVHEVSKRKKDYKGIVVDNSFGKAETYFHFYDESLVVIIADDSWRRPENLKGKKLLFVRQGGIKSDGKLIKNIYLPGNSDRDIFAQLLEYNQ